MLQKQYPAHIADDGRVQTLEDHLSGTAFYARRALKKAGMENTGYFAGMTHDAGKYTKRFSDYINGSGEKKGSVIHTFTGVRLIIERFHTGNPKEKLAAELLAYAVGAHHGLFDCIDRNCKNGFEHRMNKEGIDYEEAVANFYSLYTTSAELDQWFHQSAIEIEQKFNILMELAQKGKKQEQGDELYFYFNLLERTILSALIEGDRRDTAEFMNGRKSNLTPEGNPEIWRQVLERVETTLSNFASDTPIQEARSVISQQCKEAASKSEGVYRLNVPTGAGKTLASLRYALAHAEKHNKSRIIFTSPLLSILEQNADVLRSFIGNDDLILEHHSNVVHEKEIPEEVDRFEFMCENWQAPIIITTLVQLLNTMFDGKTSAIRRFHSLIDSVIVIDEVQTVPLNMLSLFNMAVNYLTSVCCATIVLCSATQPCLEETNHSIIPPINDIVPYQEELWKEFQRTKLLDAGSRTLEDIPEFIQDLFQETNSLLIVCNNRLEAKNIFEQVEKDDIEAFHLSASMCPEHRRNTIDAIRKSFCNQEGKKTLCVSTQVIEAGVDISFGAAVRLTAGMDSIIQTAGRCNRNHENPTLAPVYILRCRGENLTRLKEIEWGKDSTEDLMELYRQHPENFQNDLTGNKAIDEYYKQLYKKAGNSHYQDFSLKDLNCSLFSLLSTNLIFSSNTPNNSYVLLQSFKLAGERFQVFDQNTETVLVPYGEGKQIILDLLSQKAQYDFAYREDLLKRSKPYTISIYAYQRDALLEQGTLHGIFDNKILYLDAEGYSEKLGLLLNRRENDFLEVS